MERTRSFGTPLFVRTGAYRPYWPTYIGGGALRTPVIDGADTDGLPIFAEPLLLTGLELQYVGATYLRLLPGVWSAGVPYAKFGFTSFSGLPYMDIHPDAVGLNGLDKDYRGAGSSPFFTDGWYYAYLMGKSGTPWNDMRVVLSQGISVTTVRGNLNANVPGSSAYNFIRKMPFAVYYDSALSGFRLFNMRGGYPLPGYEYIGADCTSNWLIASIANATGSPIVDQSVSCATWVPDNGRFCDLVMELTTQGGSGTAKLRTPGVPGQGECLSIEATATLPVRLRSTMITLSTRTLLASVPNGTTLNIYSRGFNIRELV